LKECDNQVQEDEEIDVYNSDADDTDDTDDTDSTDDTDDED
jgi:hypothetical protein